MKLGDKCAEVNRIGGIFWEVRLVLTSPLEGEGRRGFASRWGKRLGASMTFPHPPRPKRRGTSPSKLGSGQNQPMRTSLDWSVTFRTQITASCRDQPNNRSGHRLTPGREPDRRRCVKVVAAWHDVPGERSDRTYRLTKRTFMQKACGEMGRGGRRWVRRSRGLVGRDSASWSFSSVGSEVEVRRRSP